MEWWTVLKGRGKIRIPAKSKQLDLQPHPTSKPDSSRNRRLERRKKKAEERDAFQRQRAFNPLGDVNDDINAVNFGEQSHGNQRDRLVSTKRGPIHRWRRGKPDTRDTSERRQLGGYDDTLDWQSMPTTDSGVPLTEEEQKRFLQSPTKLELPKFDFFGDYEPMGHAMESVRSQIPKMNRQSATAFDRPGFRTGGGEALPLPESEESRDRKRVREIYEQQNSLFPLPSRADKVNTPQGDKQFSPQAYEEIQRLNAELERLNQQQYTQGGERVE
ncbi:MAG: hypothetical protein CL524_15035 [Aequorivita sp.]|nr:hypothetical protein [Aequorivita sp.]